MTSPPPNQSDSTTGDGSHLPGILLVEDESADAELLQRAFKKAGLRNPVFLVSDGQQALDYLLGNGEFSNRKNFPLPILVLLDLKLPKVSGLDVLKQIKSEDQIKRIPVVVLTSSEQSDDINRAYDLGANSYLVKPVRFSAFCEIASEIKLYWLLLNNHPEVDEA